MKEPVGMTLSRMKAEPLSAVENPCHLCAPLGAVVFFSGLEGGIAILHGSQGCSTYVRRYLISHFREPVDVASSNFIESAAIFGGRDNLKKAIANVIRQYRPKVIGLATTCLVETMGEDINQLVTELQGLFSEVVLVPISTPGFIHNHREGFQLAQNALIERLCNLELDRYTHGGSFTEGASREENQETLEPAMLLFPHFASTEDLRWFRSLSESFDMRIMVIGDYSTSLDSGPWFEYQGLGPGGSPITELRAILQASLQGALPKACAVGIGTLPLTNGNPVATLTEGLHWDGVEVPIPIGLHLTDRFMKVVSQWSGRSIPDDIRDERNRLRDAYVDAHKYLSGIRCAIVGDEDLVFALASFLLETGARPVLCASGGNSGYLTRELAALRESWGTSWPSDFEIQILNGVDYTRIEHEARHLQVQMVIGPSKAYKMAKALNVPLLRCGFPIHDRFGASRLRHVGYEGSYNLLSLMVNTLISMEQDANPVGYTYY
jgi:nitrogenase molybdenum-iron protein NifN